MSRRPLARLTTASSCLVVSSASNRGVRPRLLKQEDSSTARPATSSARRHQSPTRQYIVWLLLRTRSPFTLHRPTRECQKVANHEDKKRRTYKQTEQNKRSKSQKAKKANCIRGDGRRHDKNKNIRLVRAPRFLTPTTPVALNEMVHERLRRRTVPVGLRSNVDHMKSVSIQAAGRTNPVEAFLLAARRPRSRPRPPRPRPRPQGENGGGAGQSTQTRPHIVMKRPH